MEIIYESNFKEQALKVSNIVNQDRKPVTEAGDKICWPLQSRSH